MSALELLFLVSLASGMAMIVAVVAVAGWRALRDERRLKGNRCLSCGYDWRQSPGQCPECGAGREAKREP